MCVCPSHLDNREPGEKGNFSATDFLPKASFMKYILEIVVLFL